MTAPTRTPPDVGRKYWWVRIPDKEPEDMKVEVVDDEGIIFTIPVYQQGNLGALRLVPQLVRWTWEEWEAAKNSVCDCLPTVRPEDCGPLEEPCRTCRGTRWEHTQSSEVVPCIWCQFTGKQEKIPPTTPTHTRRSPYHPKVPIDKDNAP